MAKIKVENLRDNKLKAELIGTPKEWVGLLFNLADRNENFWAALTTAAMVAARIKRKSLVRMDIETNANIESIVKDILQSREEQKKAN